MSYEWLATVTNGEFYPSFLLILASITFLIGKWKLAENNFHKIIGNFSKLELQNEGKRSIGMGIFPQLILLMSFHYPNRNV